jgi:bifunctional ADP-heptose synthase (sugar kinase/adenylyltransferase)
MKLANNLVELSEICSKLRSEGKMISLVSGIFNFLTCEHLKFLVDSAQWGSLIVGVKSDEFSIGFDGVHNVLISDQERVMPLMASTLVEAVVIFGDEYELVKAVKPDVYIVSKALHIRIQDDLKSKKWSTERETNFMMIDSKHE